MTLGNPAKPTHDALNYRFKEGLHTIATARSTQRTQRLNNEYVTSTRRCRHSTTEIAAVLIHSYQVGGENRANVWLYHSLIHRPG